jgi:dTDP-4-amino-4,6-dideoxygalactose transaminase
MKPFKKPIFVTRPLLPDIQMVYEKINEIWKSKWLTNMGKQHEELEKKLKAYLKVKNISLFCNGTLALELACKALRLSGEVITTPFTFPATINSLIRNQLTPIFCDINYENFNINEDLIEDLITPQTSAIMPVHVFGNPCNILKIKKVANKYNLKVIYDAAHCFGVEYYQEGIGNFGDISMFSFHSTKIYHTLEGGALSYRDLELKDKLYLLKNFGIKNENEVVLPGTNAKMNEFQAAIGLINLKIIDEEIRKRKQLAKIYRENLQNLEGIKCLKIRKNIKYNYQYFPILINSEKYSITRDRVYNEMKKYNVYPRKYFYPLCTDYKYFPFREKINLPIAKRVANQVLCLPIYGGLKSTEVKEICQILYELDN